MGIELRFKNTTTKRKSTTEITYKADTFEELWKGVEGFLQAQQWDTSKIVSRQLDTIDRMANRQVDGIQKATERRLIDDPTLFEIQHQNDD